MLISDPDYAFADALLLALARALHLATPDDAAQLSDVCGERPPAPDAVAIPFGCVRYQRSCVPKIVPQLYVNGRKTSLGHFPYTPEGAAQAARARAAAVAVKQAGGSAEEIRQAARAVQAEEIAHLRAIIVAAVQVSAERGENSSESRGERA